jgi:hypothetical protein
LLKNRGKRRSLAMAFHHLKGCVKAGRCALFSTFVSLWVLLGMVGQLISVKGVCYLLILLPFTFAIFGLCFWRGRSDEGDDDYTS